MCQCVFNTNHSMYVFYRWNKTKNGWKGKREKITQRKKSSPGKKTGCKRREEIENESKQTWRCQHKSTDLAGWLDPVPCLSIYINGLTAQLCDLCWINMWFHQHIRFILAWGFLYLLPFLLPLWKYACLFCECNFWSHHEDHSVDIGEINSNILIFIQCIFYVQIYLYG